LNRDAPLFDGSLAESLQQLAQWRHSRFGVSSPKPLSQKLQRCLLIVKNNKLNFFLLLAFYFLAETMGNACLLVLHWTIDKDSPKSGYLVLVQLTANWPVRIWRSVLNICLLHVVLQSLKRRGNELDLSDIIGIRSVLTLRIFVSVFVSDVVLSSPLAVAQALISSDLVWAIVYLIFGFLLNWLFGLAPILLFEDPNLSIVSCFVWSAAIALDPATCALVFVSCAVIFLATPLLVSTPFLLVLQVLTFFEVFGYKTAAEVYYTPQSAN
jgi:hypothetical protein